MVGRIQNLRCIDRSELPGSEATSVVSGIGVAVSRAEQTVIPSHFSKKLAANPTSEENSERHILYVIDQLCQLGGAERVLLEIVRRLPRNRFRVSIVTFKLDPALECLKNLSADIHVLPLECTYDFEAARMALRLRRMIRKENVSVVHTFFETSDLWAAPIAKLAGCPVIVSSRRDMGILRTRKHHLAYPVVNRVFDRVLAVSNEVRSFCVKQDGLPSDRVETLYNGVDLQDLDRRAMQGNSEAHFGSLNDAPVITTLANIRSIKGIDVLIRAAKIVCSEFPSAVFLVIGRVLEEDTMAALRTQVESSQLTKNIRFVGAAINPFPMLRRSNVFCLPSRTEGFSNALLEAMGCGLPCVATRVGGNGEAITQGRNGFLVESEDSPAMAASILKVLRDPILARELGQEARKSVETRFSMEAMMLRLENVYDELLVTKRV